MFGNGSNCRYPRAASCDGVLFFGADADGTLSQKREHVFTKWDPTASSDMEALRVYFDSNGDGKLTSADAAFAQFKVLVTNADGSTTVKTLAQLGITEINLTEDAMRGRSQRRAQVSELIQARALPQIYFCRLVNGCRYDH